jgi:hypothetical protein
VPEPAIKYIRGPRKRRCAHPAANTGPFR